MEKDNFAVITGDVVNSSKIEGDYAKVLNDIAKDIIQYQNPEFIFEIYRGDSFQGLVTEPGKALLLSLIIRAGLRRNTRGKNLESIWDARISIGIGKVKNLKLTAETKIGTLDGEAFILSGKAMDKMKNENSLIKISTSDDQFNKEFAAVCPLIDVITGRWSTAQAEAVYIYLLRNLTQKEIGNLLNTSQRAISKRLETSSIEKIKPVLFHFNELILWKYSN
jgi:hypothetical protein